VSVRGWLLFAAMSVIWGIPYLLIKVAVEGLSVPVLVFARTAVGALVLIPLTLRHRAGLALILTGSVLATRRIEPKNALN
jgi:drug/metabolite transporter (DMT)-like permease